MPVEHLPGTRLSPKVVLHRTLDEIEKIKGVVVIIQWEDRTFDIDWSQMATSEMALAALLAQKAATDNAFPEAIQTQEIK